MLNNPFSSRTHKWGESWANDVLGCSSSSLPSTRRVIKHSLGSRIKNGGEHSSSGHCSTSGFLRKSIVELFPLPQGAASVSNKFLFVFKITNYSLMELPNSLLRFPFGPFQCCSVPQSVPVLARPLVVMCGGGDRKGCHLFSGEVIGARPSPHLVSATVGQIKTNRILLIRFNWTPSLPSTGCWSCRTDEWDESENRSDICLWNPRNIRTPTHEKSAIFIGISRGMIRLHFETLQLANFVTEEKHSSVSLNCWSPDFHSFQLLWCQSNRNWKRIWFEFSKTN